MSTALKITITLLFFVGVLLIGGTTGLIVAPSVLALIIYVLEVFNIETTFTVSYPIYDGIGLIVLFGFFSVVPQKKMLLKWYRWLKRKCYRKSFHNLATF
jgi:hypothetical protein